MGRSPCCTQEGLKKGPWTQDEDEILIAFVKEHGHGNWRALPKKCGLLRCGKSCRLRWNNYLRPDIKRGLFTPSEEQKIIQLHALVGNKWAFIASQLPKRTDNEIKNYWNTVLKKRLEKLGLRTSLVSFSTDRALISAGAERQRPHDMSKGMQRQDNENNKSSSNASKKPSCNNSLSVMSCTHLAQWESARLEAEARLRRASQSSKTHKPFPFAHMGHSFSSSTSTTSTAFSSFSNHTHTHHQSHLPHLSNHTHTHHQSQLPHLSNPKQTNHQSQLPQLSTCSIPTILPSSVSSPCLTHHPSTINPALSTASSLSLSAVVSMPSSCCSSTLSSLSSQESIASSALTLASSGRLSWQAKELSFTTSPSIGDASHSSLITHLLCQIEKDNGQEVELQASLKEGTAELRGQDQQLNMEAKSCKVDLNSTMESSKDLNSTMQNWHDLIFEMENSCSDVVSSCWKGPQREEFTHDSLSFFGSTPKSGTLQCPHGTLDLEGLNLLHFDNLLPCEPYANQQYSHVLNMKELLWDSPTTLSMSSTSIVN